MPEAVVVAFSVWALFAMTKVENALDSLSELSLLVADEPVVGNHRYRCRHRYRQARGTGRASQQIAKGTAEVLNVVCRMHRAM